jgi:hypothetical protein
MTFTQLMHSMVDADILRLQQGKRMPDLVEITTVRH